MRGVKDNKKYFGVDDSLQKAIAVIDSANDQIGEVIATMNSSVAEISAIIGNGTKKVKQVHTDIVTVSSFTRSSIKKFIVYQYAIISSLLVFRIAVVLLQRIF
ncbi:unnamed protein product [Gongylonema pulchrum]|uniref:Methyl-accepting chemotaxis protein n=1 Tax=Gongylonema pulchrum TaxID=637853 RepID=A0A183DMW1_9BILA|nr:unnamed protein product [Gongylonema pulchrum]